MARKVKLSFTQILNMNVGFFGIQYSFGLQQSAVNPIYDFLGASPHEIPLLNLAGPMTGLIVQPIIGAMSDKTWSPKWGRRKPYFLVGALLCSLALFIYPFSSSLWMAAGLLWILDAGNNTALEPYRAFIADTLDEEQQPLGFQMQSFFTGLGQTLANLSLFIFPMIFVGMTGKLPTWVFASFFLGAIMSIGTIWWSMRKTEEVPPTEEEIAKIKAEPLNLLSPCQGHHQRHWRHAKGHVATSGSIPIPVVCPVLLLAKQLEKCRTKRLGSYTCRQSRGLWRSRKLDRIGQRLVQYCHFLNGVLIGPIRQKIRSQDGPLHLSPSRGCRIFSIPTYCR